MDHFHFLVHICLSGIKYDQYMTFNTMSIKHFSPADKNSVSNTQTLFHDYGNESWLCVRIPGQLNLTMCVN